MDPNQLTQGENWQQYFAKHIPVADQKELKDRFIRLWQIAKIQNESEISAKLEQLTTTDLDFVTLLQQLFEILLQPTLTKKLDEFNGLEFWKAMPLADSKVFTYMMIASLEQPQHYLDLYNSLKSIEAELDKVLQ